MEKKIDLKNDLLWLFRLFYLCFRGILGPPFQSNFSEFYEFHC